VGDHLKKRRLDLGLLQKDVARQIGTHLATYWNWETGANQPGIRHAPGVISFLGYDPFPAPQTLGERVRATRRRQGLSHRELAARLGLDPSTVEAWENNQVRRPYPRLVRLFEEYVEGVY
jgi:transcriptional regulator with XRE-family HTH domain